MDSIDTGSDHRPQDNPQLTIVVIAFNEAQRIRACLEALLCQSTTIVYRVVVVDDGSTDATARVVEEMQSQDPRLQLIRHRQNRGRGAARHTGQMAANEPMIAFVDADIVVPFNWIETCVTELQTASAVSGVPRPDGDCAVIWGLFRPRMRLRPGPAEFTGGNVMFRAEALCLEPFQEQSRLGEDFRLAKRMARRGLVLRTLTTLTVDHLETKSYIDGGKWMWSLGVDASSLPFEFHIFRIPDLTWLVWLGSSVFACVLSSESLIPWWLTAVIFGGITLTVNLVYTATRFEFWSSPFRWLGAASANFPYILVYLMGRLWGTTWLLSSRRRRYLGFGKSA